MQVCTQHGARTSWVKRRKPTHWSRLSTLYSLCSSRKRVKGSARTHPSTHLAPAVASAGPTGLQLASAMFDACPTL